MATATKRKTSRLPKPNGKVRHRLIFNGQMEIPAEFSNLSSFRRWCMSPAYPERGDVFWIDGDIWVSDELEDFSTHNAIKTEIIRVLGNWAKAVDLGYVYSDGMRLVHPRASLSVEPDAMYASFESVESRRVQLKPNKKDRILELVGSPEMVLEVTSDSSVSKDERLEQKYFAAGVIEYWRVDARGKKIRFDILMRGPGGFVATPRQGGRIHSTVFDRTFELLVKTGRIGLPNFTLDVSE